MNTPRRSRRPWTLAALVGAAAITFAGCEFLVLLDDMAPVSTIESRSAQLQTFGSCSELQGYLRGEAVRTVQIAAAAEGAGLEYNPFGYMSNAVPGGGVVGSTGGTGAPNTPFSTTNDQEAGVAEADIVQANATHLFVLRDDRLAVVEAVNPRIRGDEPDFVAEVEIEGDPIEMMLEGDRLVVFVESTQEQVMMRYNQVASARPESHRLVTAIVFDVGDPETPVLVREVNVDGSLVATRRIDNQIVMVTRANLAQSTESPAMLEGAEWVDEESARIATAPLDTWMPWTYRSGFVDGLPTEPVGGPVGCSNALRSEGAGGTDAVAIVTFDWTRPTSDVQTTTVFGNGSLVYAATDTIVLAHTGFVGAEVEDVEDERLFDSVLSDLTNGLLSGDSALSFGSSESSVSGEVTDVHEFGLNRDGSVDYVGSGRVQGYALNAFSIDAHDGYVRVATYETDQWGEQRSNVYILDDRQMSDIPLMQTGGSSRELAVVGHAGDIGVDEELFGVRFIDDYAYLVTFRQTDPLWVIDLREPTQPTIRGELMVPGFSTYLHPISGGRLLAVGESARNNGSLKVSLFDVSNPDDPRAMEEIVERGHTSIAVQEHRAFRYLEDERVLAVPTDAGGGRLVLWRVEDSGLSPLGTFDHGMLGDGTVLPDIARAYRIGDVLYAISDAGVTGIDMGTWRTIGGTTF